MVAPAPPLALHVLAGPLRRGGPVGRLIASGSQSHVDTGHSEPQAALLLWNGALSCWNIL